MKLTKFLVDPKLVTYCYENDDEKKHLVQAYEAPLPEAYRALLALQEVIDSSLSASDFSKTSRVRGFTLSYTAEGNRSMQVYFALPIGTGDQEHLMKTPYCRIDSPTEADAVILSGVAQQNAEEAIAAAEAYVKGHRSQQRLPFDEESIEEADPGILDGDPLPIQFSTENKA